MLVGVVQMGKGPMAKLMPELFPVREYQFGPQTMFRVEPEWCVVCGAAITHDAPSPNSYCIFGTVYKAQRSDVRDFRLEPSDYGGGTEHNARPRYTVEVGSEVCSPSCQGKCPWRRMKDGACGQAQRIFWRLRQQQTNLRKQYQAEAVRDIAAKTITSAKARSDGSKRKNTGLTNQRKGELRAIRKWLHEQLGSKNVRRPKHARTKATGAL